jgi:hypothetical protein
MCRKEDPEPRGQPLRGFSSASPSFLLLATISSARDRVWPLTETSRIVILVTFACDEKRSPLQPVAVP